MSSTKGIPKSAGLFLTVWLSFEGWRGREEKTAIGGQRRHHRPGLGERPASASPASRYICPCFSRLESQKLSQPMSGAFCLSKERKKAHVIHYSDCGPGIAVGR